MRIGGVGAAGGLVVSLACAVMLMACGEQVTVQQISTGATLCQNDFEACVNPIFNSSMRRSDGSTVTCASGGCHEVGVGFGGAFKIFPNAATASELEANFIVAKAFSNLNSPADSKLLLEPLTGTSSITGSHTGGDIFTSSGDVCYIAIRNWIANPVNDQTSPQCGLCTPPNLAQCGYP